MLIVMHINLILIVWSYVYNRMVKGGCIVFDDYDKKPWPGATKAVDEFLSMIR